ncbi:MAG: carbon-nitrogen hydrolase family protein [Terriglobia bacterium]
MKIAIVQMDVQILDKALNLKNILDRLRTAANAGAKIVIFPECALTGYCFESLEEARPVAESIPGPSTGSIARVARELDCTVVVGMLESSGTKLFNSAAVIGPEGVHGKYRKIHLPYIGADRFATPGDIPFPVFATRHGKIGVVICYDCSFPESGRSIKLNGADLLAIPTNWPSSSDTFQHVPSVRAMENHIIVAAADRVGKERGFTFAGHSQIIDFSGITLKEASETEEVVLDAQVDMDAASRNRVIRSAGLYEFDRIADRRPEMYAALTQPVERLKIAKA